MSERRTRVLVTGADQHQGLAVIRGLGRGGVDVIAAGPHGGSLGFHSRYATDRVVYRAPGLDAGGFVDDVIAAAQRTNADLVMPAVESTLAALVERRVEVERVVPVAMPQTSTIMYALDKRAMLTLAGTVNIPVPGWASGPTVDALMERARGMQPPFVVKPRGHGNDLAVPRDRDFKVRYAEDLDALYRILAPLSDQAVKLLVQEYVPGIGRCAAVVCRRGRPVAMFAYEREREYPLSGGVSVVRRSIPLDAQLEAITTQLLKAVAWHGVAMVEYKYDRRERQYTLMEINGRFQASTALCIDAGVNLPLLAMAVHLDRAMPAPQSYRIGLVERWLRGDMLALFGALRRDQDGREVQVNVARVLWQFMRDFGRAAHYDEFSVDDWRPALAEARDLAGNAVRSCAGALARIVRAAPVVDVPGESLPTGRPLPRVAASVATQRSMRV
jgi:predicted ATP-grasp superfamily ATP-dependent carboligase